MRGPTRSDEGATAVDAAAVAGEVQVSGWFGVQNDTAISCRINVKHEVEFTVGTWRSGVELVFERYALERFVKLATAALNEPLEADEHAERGVLGS